MYGLGATNTLSPALAALPDCFSQELMNCLSHKNVDGLPKAQCDAILHGYDAEKDVDALNDAIDALRVCEGPSMVPYVGAAFAAGIFLTAIFMKKR
jgi:hypothetical protein